jgi:hypothetical protein
MVFSGDPPSERVEGDRTTARFGVALDEVNTQTGEPAHLREHVSLACSPNVPIVRAGFHDLVPGVRPVGKLRWRLAHPSLIGERVTEIPQEHRNRHPPRLPDTSPGP